MPTRLLLLQMICVLLLLELMHVVTALFQVQYQRSIFTQDASFFVAVLECVSDSVPVSSVSDTVDVLLDQKCCFVKTFVFSDIFPQLSLQVSAVLRLGLIL